MSRTQPPQSTSDMTIEEACEILAEENDTLGPLAETMLEQL